MTTAPQEQQDEEVIAHWIVMVINGVAEEIIRCAPRLNAILLSEPVIVEIDHPETSGVAVGDIYDAETKTFSKPVEQAPAETPV